MTRELSHRGPDQDGFYFDDRLGMGMRRLSIIDLRTGKQPISNEEGTVSVVYNGEIYNFPELRLLLEKKGHRFATDTDTEVIVHAYEEYGFECLKRFNGMFAFSLWDSEKKILFIARDRLGIKPLYYHHGPQRFAFASEIKSIIKIGDIKRTINRRALYHYLGYEFVPAPDSIFEGIRKLPQGHYLVFDSRQNSVRVKKYWDCSFRAKRYSEDQLAGQLLENLKRAVERRLISDVPLGAFLSGGIDSSAIVGLMSGLKEDPVRTFSIGFEDASYNELAHARKVAECFGTDHTEKMITPDAVNLTGEIVKYFDEPFADISAIPTFLVSELARTKVKVVLSGDGGDELFAGYERYVASRIAGTLPIPRPVGRIAGSLFKPREKKKGLANMFQRYSEGLQLPDDARHMRWQYFLNKNLEDGLFQKDLRALADRTDAFGPLNTFYGKSGLKGRLDREQYADIKLYLADDILVKVDRMSMAHSLEARVPFLDHTLVEFAMTIPPGLRLRSLRTKHILKKAVSGLLPRDIINRKKEGFSIPIKNWLRTDLRDLMKEKLERPAFSRERLFNQRFINKLMKLHIRGDKNYSHQLWALMMFGMWYERYMTK